MTDSATVLLAGVGALLLGAALVLWWMRRPPLASRAPDGSQRITVVVSGGYAPSRFRARPGVPLNIHFERRDDEECGDRVIFPDFGVERALRRSAVTTVMLRPDRPGEFLFTCGNGSYHGMLMVSPDRVGGLRRLLRPR